MKKRLIAIIFALLAMLLLAACGPAPGDSASGDSSSSSEGFELPWIQVF